MSLEDEYQNLNGDIDTKVIRRYLSGGYHLSAGEALGLCEEIDDQAAEIAALRARLAEGEELLAQSVAIYDRQRAALEAIANIGGNLSDEAIQAVGGVNDARALALKVIYARRIAQAGLGEIET